MNTIKLHIDIYHNPVEQTAGNLEESLQKQTHSG